MARTAVYAYDDWKAPVRVGWFDPASTTAYRALPSPPRRSADGITEWTAPQVLHRTPAHEWVRVTEFDEPMGNKVEYVSRAEAMDWLVSHGYDQAVTDVSTRGPGRPEVGGLVQVRLGDMLDEVDLFARQENLSRAAAVRSLIQRGLDSGA